MEPSSKIKTIEQKTKEFSIVRLDKANIEKDLAMKGVFSRGNIILKDISDLRGENTLIGSIKNNRSIFAGQLNANFQRDGFGYNKFENGDSCFGKWANDSLREGIYIYNITETRNALPLKEYYFGQWNESVKDGTGTYVWLNEENYNNDLYRSNFEIFNGNIENDIYKQGFYLTKQDDEFFVYYGKFDMNFKKNDAKALFYDNARDRVFKGNFVNDSISEGYLMSFREDRVHDVIYLEFINNELKDILTKDEIDETLMRKISKEASMFRHELLDFDWFGEYYKCVKKNIIDIEEYCYLEKYEIPSYEKVESLSVGVSDINIFGRLRNKI